MKLLNPSKYVFVTSAPLSPQNKKEIVKCFAPYIQTTRDILGNEDLNNLLGLHHEIEEKYYRLWLCSTNILNKILHKNVINWSEFKLNECIESKNKFVYNENYAIAKNILDKYNYVIISGIPGIGKTTLAEILVLEYLKDGYDDFVFMSDKIDNAFDFYDENKKQIFLFDDFLGATSFEPASKNFDGNLASLINRIRKAKNKKFILTTREYILQEAKLHYERLASDKIDIAKCTIDLGSYTDKIKAQILYNHLYYAKIPLSSIESLLEKNKFLLIVRHKNFNPRLVETIILQELWDSSLSGSFFDKVYDVFDHPNRIWNLAFNKLDNIAQYALLILVTMPTPVMLKDWRKAFLKFANNTLSNLCISCDEPSWKNALKVLDGCFVKTDRMDNVKIVEFYNPSIVDFLVDYLKYMHETTNLLIDNVVFADQLTSIYIQGNQDTKAQRKIVLVKANMKHLAKSVITVLNNFQICKLFFWKPDHELADLFKYIVKLKKMFPRLFEDYIKFSPQLLSNDDFMSRQESPYYKMEVLQKFDDHINYLDKTAIIKSIFNDIDDANTLEIFVDYIVNNPEVEFVIDELIKEKVRDIIDEEVFRLEDKYELDVERDKAIFIFDNLEIDGDDLLFEIDEKIEQIELTEAEADEAIADGYHSNNYHNNTRSYNSENDEIIVQFQSLRDSGR